LASNTEVDPRLLDNAAQVATTAGEDISTGLTSLLTEIESMSGSFKGGAGSAAQNSSAALGEHLRGLLGALNRMADGVTQSNRAFASTDAGSQQEIASVAGNVSGSGHVSNALRG
jgi:WXG100 family type VII secretion target